MATLRTTSHSHAQPQHRHSDIDTQRIYRDVFSGKPQRRLQLDRLMKVINYGDKLIITRLDRIARSLTQRVQLLETLSERGVIVEVLNIGVIDDTPTGRLIQNIMLSFSEFEHDMIVQRTQEGKAIARQNADFKDGRPKKFSRVQLDHALELLETHSYKQVERLTGINVTTIYRAKLYTANRKHLHQRDSRQP